MPQLRLRFLGPPQIELDGKPITIRRRKSLALLVYLAVTGETQRRDTLATLLWPESDQSRARTLLRRELWDLNQTLGEAWLAAERETVGLRKGPDIWLDVEVFAAEVAGLTEGRTATDLSHGQTERFASAADLYRGDFLTGFTLPDSPGFDEWQFFQGEAYRQQLASALEMLIAVYSERAEYETALSHARRRLALDPLHEPAHRGLLRLYALVGQQAAALRQYEECKRILDEELGVPPSEETTELYEAIRTRRFPTADKGMAWQGDRMTEDSPPLSHADTHAEDHHPPPLQSQAEIRPVTVLCVGLSRAGDDFWDQRPDETAEQQERLDQVVTEGLAEFDVSVEPLAGGGLLMVFGASEIHEDDAERAVRAALQIQTASDLSIAIGVNTGTAYLGQMSTAVAGRATVTGAIVNLAVRLQAQTGPGETLIGAGTYRQVRGVFRTIRRTLDLPGAAQPVPVYKVQRLRRRTQKARGIEGLHAKLIGRDEELAKLRGALAQVLAGDGQMVSLIGEAGLGKSRLVAELHVSTVQWLEGRCQEMTAATAYWPFLDLLRTHFGWGPEDDEAARARSLVAELEALAAEGYLTPTQVEEIGPLLGNLFTIQFGNEWDKHLRHVSPEQIRHRTFRALADFLAALARRRPLVLVLEDLHWADDLSLDLVVYLMDMLAAAPLLLFCVYRPEPEHRCWRLATIAARKCPARFTELQLRELSPQQSYRLIASLLAVDDLPEAVRERIEARAQGSPFFVEEVVRSLIDAGLIEQDGGVWRARAEAADVAVPETVQSVILGRVDRLELAMKQLLQRAAVVGRLFGQRVLAQVMPSDIDLDEALWDLEDAGLIYQEATVPEVIYAFRHVLAQEAIYSTLPRRRRLALHGQVAAALEALYGEELAEHVESLAYHYDRSDEAEKAIDYLLKAGEKARHAYLNDEAIHYFKRVLVRLETMAGHSQQSAWRFAALRGLGQIYVVMARPEEAEHCLRDAIALGQTIDLSRHDLLLLYFWLGDHFMNDGGRTEESMRVAMEGLALLEDNQETFEAAMMNAIMAWSYYIAGNYKAMHEWAMRSTPFLQRLPYSEELRPVYGAVRFAYIMNGEPEQERVWHEVNLERAHHHHDLRGLGEVLATSGINYPRLLGRLDEWQTKLNEGEAFFVQSGDFKRVNWIQMDRSLTYLQLGDVDKAESSVYHALDLAEKVNPGHVWDVYYCLSTLALIRHELDEAERLAHHVVHHSSNHPINCAEALILLGRTQLAQGRQIDAVRTYEEATRLLACLDVRVADRLFQWRLRPAVLNAFSGLEEALQDGEQYRAFCQKVLTSCAGRSDAAAIQWYLEPCEPAPEPAGTAYHDPFAGTLQPGWTWYDPEQDCHYVVENGLILHSANLRDLYGVNVTAPRLVHSVPGNCTVQTCLKSLSPDLPAIGGLVFWWDRHNYLCLNRGLRGPTELSLEGRLQNRNLFGGRGHVPLVHDGAPVWLRLERSGSLVRSFCSADGESWFTIGQVDFPVGGPVEVGLYGIGNIDRTIYPGAFPDGTAIHFDGFWLWHSDHYP